MPRIALVVAEVYVRAIEAADDVPRQVSTAGGRLPLWRSDGRELFYIDSEEWMVVRPVLIAEQPDFGPAQRLFRIPPAPLNPHTYDVTRDGEQFILSTTDDTLPPLPLTVIHNWRVGLDLPGSTEP